jgi:hypothetical protein
MPGYRGRVIFPFFAGIFRLDTEGTLAVTPPAGSFGGAGYDPEFREPVLVEQAAGDTVGKVARVELPEILVKCQVDEVEESEAQRQQVSGNVPNSRMVLVFHAADLEKALLMGADGNPLIRVNSRLGRVLDRSNKHVWTPGASRPGMKPGFFLTSIRPTSWGLSGHARNLFISIWEDREVGAFV